jgi:hypothetical protein
MSKNCNKYGIVIEKYDNIEYVIFESIGLAIKHVYDYDIEFEDLTPEQLIWIWLEEIEKLDESKLDENHKAVLNEIRNILNSSHDNDEEI